MKSTQFLPFVLATAQASAVGTALAGRACTPFTNAITNAASCCDTSGSFLTIVAAPLNLGICCPFGTILSGLLCVPPPPPPKTGICSGVGVCPSVAGQDLGIKYGSCYVLESVSNMYLGHDSVDKYIIEGENPGVVFRVCDDTTTCATNNGNLVGTNSTWYMQDQFGLASGTGFGWLGGEGDLTVQPTSAGALVLGGSSICYGGQCAICQTFPPGGAAAPCPLQPGQSHLGVANNPNSCQPFFYQEVACRSEK